MKRRIFIFALFFFGLIGCQLPMRADSKPSIIIIAAESLSASDVNCNLDPEDLKGGFKSFCEESIRFTHAYTNSIMSQSSMASLLTGELPLEHGIHSNGKQALDPLKITVAEAALEKGYATSFINSGFSIKRSSRLHQGFESYIDLAPISLDLFSIGSSSVFSEAFKVIKRDSRFKPAFQVIVLSDLLAPWVSTKNDFGETRAKGIHGQIEEVNESLGTFVENLKQSGLWNRSYIILAGLNGRSDIYRKSEVAGSNLFSENSQVTLFIKAPKGREEIPRSWKYDALVSLADVGRTVQDLLGVSLQPQKIWSPVSLMPVLSDENVQTIDRSRIIPIETGWPEITGSSGVRMSFRSGDSLLIIDEIPRLYNTLIDRSETVGSPIEDWQAVPWVASNLSKINELKIVPWKPLDRNIVEDINFVFHARSGDLFIEDGFYAQLISRLRKNPESKVLKSLGIGMMIEKKDWGSLEEFNLTWKNSRIADLLAAVHKQFGTIKDLDCWMPLFLNKEAWPQKGIPSKRLCPDLGYVEFLSLQRTGFARDSDEFLMFINSYRHFQLLKNFQLYNLSTGFMITNEFSSASDPSLVDLAFSLDSFKAFSILTNQSLPGSIIEFE